MVKKPQRYRVVVKEEAKDAISSFAREPATNFTIRIETEDGRKVCVAVVSYIGEYEGFEKPREREENYWLMSFHSEPQENKEFFEWSARHSPEKRGRYPHEEISTHLARWHEKVGGRIEYVALHEPLPKGFMHPRYADIEPVLETPKELLEMRPVPHHVPLHEKMLKGVFKRGKKRWPRKRPR